MQPQAAKPCAPTVFDFGPSRQIASLPACQPASPPTAKLFRAQADPTANATLTGPVWWSAAKGRAPAAPAARSAPRHGKPHGRPHGRRRADRPASPHAARPAQRSPAPPRSRSVTPPLTGRDAVPRGTSRLGCTPSEGGGQCRGTESCC